MTDTDDLRAAGAALITELRLWASLVTISPEWGVFEIRPTSPRGAYRTALIPGIRRSRQHPHIALGLRPFHLPFARWRDLQDALPHIRELDDADAVELQ